MKKLWHQLIGWLANLRRKSNSSGMKKTIIIGDLAKQRLFSVYSLLGNFANSNPRFVCHTAILASNQLLPATVSVFHMGPPLVSALHEQRVEAEKRELTPELVISFALDEEQKTKIARWAAKITTEDASLYEKRYVICTHVKLEKSEKGRPKYHRFNCSGYAFEALQQAGILLIDYQHLPAVDEQDLNSIFPTLPSIMKNLKRRKFYGIEEAPPWPVMMPGYLFHGAEACAEDPGTVLRIGHSGYASYPKTVDYGNR